MPRSAHPCLVAPNRHGRACPGHPRGAVAAFRLIVQRLVQIEPARIGIHYQLRLPGPRPVLHVRFALNRIGDPFVELHIDEAFEAIALGEAFDEPLAVLVGAAAYIQGCSTLSTERHGEY